MLSDLLLEIAIVTDDDDTVASVSQPASDLLVDGTLLGLVVDAAVAEDAGIVLVEEVGNGRRVSQGALGVVGQATIRIEKVIEKDTF